MLESAESGRSGTAALLALYARLSQGTEGKLDCLLVAGIAELPQFSRVFFWSKTANPPCYGEEEIAEYLRTYCAPAECARALRTIAPRHFQSSKTVHCRATANCQCRCSVSARIWDRSRICRRLFDRLQTR